MSAKPPKIRIRGLRSNGIPTGYLLGRIDAGKGDVQLVNARGLGRLGVAAARTAHAAANAAGFGFNIRGLMAAGETIGSGIWPRDVTFEDGGAKTTVVAGVASAATAVMQIWANDVSNFPVHIGDITFTAGVKAAVVTWIGGQAIVLAGRPLTLYAPASIDGALADITGVVTGRAG